MRTRAILFSVALIGGAAVLIAIKLPDPGSGDESKRSWRVDTEEANDEVRRSGNLLSSAPQLALETSARPVPTAAAAVAPKSPGDVRNGTRMESGMEGRLYSVRPVGVFPDLEWWSSFTSGIPVTTSGLPSPPRPEGGRSGRGNDPLPPAPTSQAPVIRFPQGDVFQANLPGFVAEEGGWVRFNFMGELGGMIDESGYLEISGVRFSFQRRPENPAHAEVYFKGHEASEWQSLGVLVILNPRGAAAFGVTNAATMGRLTQYSVVFHPESGTCDIVFGGRVVRSEVWYDTSLQSPVLSVGTFSSEALLVDLSVGESTNFPTNETDN